MTYVLSVGGSLLVTKDGINVQFLKRFRDFIAKEVKKGARFHLVIGGGYTARVYIKAALATAPVSHYDRDLVGIRATRLNAELLRVAFGPLAYPEIVTDPMKSPKTNKKIILAAGYKPGWSTDYVSVLLAKNNGIGTVINLSNIDHAYDKDPRKFPEAKKLIDISWREFRQIVGSKWQPGLNVPFDPVASREAQKSKIKVIILNGEKLANLGKLLAGKKFVGTTVS